MKKETKKQIGWREWVSLPEFGVKKIKAKIDSGARTSSLHAYNMHLYQKKGVKWVQFDIHPVQKNQEPRLTARTQVFDERIIKSSSGHATLRPVIRTLLYAGGDIWEIEVTLMNRDVMGFRMLLGRQALRGKFLINPSRSFLLQEEESPGSPHKTKKGKK